MCELFGVSASQALDSSPWLHKFRARGGDTADNRDGWGLAYLENGALRLYKAPTVGAHSPLFADLCDTVRAPLILGHVRRARYPRVNSFDNTHPFLRTCCGREWVFAHNGLVPEIMHQPGMRLKGLCSPRGATDSEFAFCYLLEYIASHFKPDAARDGARWFDDVASAAGLIAAHGKFNFLMSDGAHLIAYGYDRLHYLDLNDAGGRATVIATEPLTTDAWRPFAPGELRIYRAGKLVARWVARPASGAQAALPSATPGAP